MDNQVLDRLDTQGFNHVRSVPNDDPVSQMRAREDAVGDLYDQYLHDDAQIVDLVADGIIDEDVFAGQIRALINASALNMHDHTLTIAKSLAFTFMDALKTKAERKA